MAINLFSDYGGFYNNYKVTDIPKVDMDTVKKQDALRQVEEEAVPSVSVAPEIISKPQVDLRSKTADLDNISLTFNKGDDYSYLGSEFEIEKLDINQAISDMRKDKILEDYQYFVGSQNDLTSSINNEDGRVFLKF